jgi:hypothetical protein
LIEKHRENIERIKTMSGDTTVGNFDVIRLNKAIDIIHNNKKYRIKKNSIGVTQFEPYVGHGVLFEALPERLLVPLNENDMDYVFKNIRTTIRTLQVRDDVG